MAGPFDQFRLFAGLRSQHPSLREPENEVDTGVILDGPVVENYNAISLSPNVRSRDSVESVEEARGRTLLPGTVRTRKDGKYKLTSDGRWLKVKTSTARQKAGQKANAAYRARMALESTEVTESNGAHHFVDSNGKIYVDTAFINTVQQVIAGCRLNHMGFGEFTLVTPDGEVEFDNMRGKDFQGQVGRSHQMYDAKGGQKLAEKIIKEMESKNKSARSERAEEAAPVGGRMRALVAEDRPGVADVYHLETQSKTLLGLVQKIDALVANDKNLKNHKDRAKRMTAVLNTLKKAAEDLADEAADYAEVMAP